MCTLVWGCMTSGGMGCMCKIDMKMRARMCTLVWGCMTSGGMGCMCKIDMKMTALYVQSSRWGGEDN